MGLKSCALGLPTRTAGRNAFFHDEHGGRNANALQNQSAAEATHKPQCKRNRNGHGPDAFRTRFGR
eukprot:1152916-Lingulodinium_polyedra.AAC.1